MKKKLSLFIAGLTLLTGLNSYAENSCQYQVVLESSGSSKRVSLQLKSPGDVSFGTVKTFSNSSQMGYSVSCRKMIQFLSEKEGAFLTRGCSPINFECNEEAIQNALERIYSNN